MMKNKPKKTHTKKTKYGYLKRKWIEFCERTDLHGYKYIVMPGLTIYERYCWALAVVVCLMTAVFLVITAWKWYARNPIVTVIESTYGAIWDVPFPAVTICNLNLVSKKATQKLVKTLKFPSNVTEHMVYDWLRYIPVINNPFFVTEKLLSNMTLLQHTLNLNGIHIDTLFQQLSPTSCSNLLDKCIWKNTLYQCEQIFREILTYLGMCCTFNFFGLDPPGEWLSSNDLLRAKKPRHVASCGYQTSLKVLVNVDVDDYYTTPFTSYGALVFIDSPYNMPDLNSPARMVNVQTEMFFAVSPELTYATRGISSFPLETRKCFFDTEEQLKPFKIYTYHNCVIMKRAEIISAVCGCVPFFLSHIASTYRMCNFEDLECLATLTEYFDQGQVQNKSNRMCLPNCEHSSYPLEISIGRLNKNVLTPMFRNREQESLNQSLLNVFFSDLVSTRYRRDVYLNWQNLLASFGGLLSLMLGFTVISGLDLILFFTVRIFCDFLIKRRRKRIQAIERIPIAKQGTLQIFDNNGGKMRILPKQAWRKDQNKKTVRNTAARTLSKEPPRYETMKF